MKSSLVRKAISYGLGVTTSLVCACPSSQIKADEKVATINVNVSAVPAEATAATTSSPKSKTTGLLLNLLAPLPGADLFYAGKWGQGLLTWVTFEGLGIWRIVRLVSWAKGTMTDADGKLIDKN